MDKTLVVPDKAKGERLDSFLGKNLEFISRRKIQVLIKKGNIFVNGKIRKPSFCLKGAEEIYLRLEEEKNQLEPFKLRVKIIYEDDDIIVVDKPAGLVTHPPQSRFNKTLVNALLYMKKELSTVNPLRRGVVHRLDKETSGVLVIAKNNYSHLKLVEQFRLRKVKKEYQALCWGKITEERLAIDLPLRRDDKNRLKMKISFVKSKEAHTEVEVKERFKDSTLLCLKPLTGRMHQIRVHLRFLGYPVVGDKKYGIKDNYDQLMLHAHKLGIYHPSSGDFREFTSPLPLRFRNFINDHR